MASSFIGRENRRLKAAKLIMENYEDGEWFTVHDIMRLWRERWVKELTEKELSKTLPILEYDRGTGYLEVEFRKGCNYKFYKYHPAYDEQGNLLPLYARREKE